MIASAAQPRPAEDVRPCPCGARKPPSLWRRGTASKVECLRCPLCKLEGRPAARISDIHANWNEAVRRVLGEPDPVPERPNDWVDVDVVLVDESGLDWKVRCHDGETVLISKSASQLERASHGATVTASLPHDYARHLGLLP